MVPMKYERKSEFVIEAVKIIIDERNIRSITEKLKEGYKEMNKINLALAEIGLEQDIIDLIKYEARLTGRGI